VRVLGSDNATPREFALGAELGFGRLDPKRFIDLARAMGIPARDAARQVMGLITEAGRVGEGVDASNTQTVSRSHWDSPG
jgi:hypothetical protein